MGVERIDCATDPRIDGYRAVRDGELLRVRGVFVAEGRLVVRRVLEDSRWRVESVLVNDAALRDLAAPIATLDPAVAVFVCPTAAFQQLTGFDLHRGCLALVRRPAPTTVDTVIGGARVVVALDGVANADNVGGIFRSAAAFNAGGVLLGPGSCDPLYRKAIRTSMGAVLRVPFAVCDQNAWLATPPRLRQVGFTVVVLTPLASSRPLDDIAERLRGERIALVVGAEDTGVSAALVQQADWCVRIPISDRVDSLNVAVAAGIALARFTAAR